MYIQPDDDDPVIAEIRQFREEYLASFGYDMDLLMEDVRRHAQKWPGERVSYKKDSRRAPGEGFQRQPGDATR
jgi:hypothetical protein